MVKKMDRRQKKTREHIFRAFIELLSKKHYNNITVGEIIEYADVGRATFYSHFETKDFLLKELCEELFCHLFDHTEKGNDKHKHIFDCDSSSSVFIHLLQHLQKNDNNILTLLSCQNNELFIDYFKKNLKDLIKNNLDFFDQNKRKNLPEDFWVNHISTTFVETVKWWINNDKKEDAEVLSKYFLTAL